VIIQTIRLHGDRYLESQFSAEAVEGTRIEEPRKFEVEVECSTGVDSMSRSRPVSLGSGKPGNMGRRVTLRSRIVLESLVPASIRWLRENQGKHVCQCGCGQPIRLEARHYWRGAPRHVHGHQNFRGHRRVLQLRQAGYLTTSEAARALGIGVTTLLRREGGAYPFPERIGGIRVYRREDLQPLGGREPS
jgi:hypothetical protein